MANSSETDLNKKRITKTKTRESQIILPVAKNKEVNSNRETEKRNFFQYSKLSRRKY